MFHELKNEIKAIRDNINSIKSSKPPVAQSEIDDIESLFSSWTTAICPAALAHSSSCSNLVCCHHQAHQLPLPLHYFGQEPTACLRSTWSHPLTRIYQHLRHNIVKTPVTYWYWYITAISGNACQ